MTKLLSVISLILAIVLFPPAALAVISNNAVPGDATYPIKRALEDGVFAVVSLNPVTKAWFAAARSDRRFKEFTTLVAQGKKGVETLTELVEQTQVAASQIDQVKDESQKQKLIQQLTESITKYDQGLQQVFSPTQVNPVPVAPVTPLSQATPTPQPTQTSAPVVVQPTPRPASTSQPTTAPTAVPTPTPRTTTAPTPSSSDADKQRQIEEARRRLEDIRRRLEEQRRTNQQGVRNTSGEEREDTNRRGDNTGQQDSGGRNGRSNENEGNSGRRK